MIDAVSNCRQAPRRLRRGRDRMRGSGSRSGPAAAYLPLAQIMATATTLPKHEAGTSRVSTARENAPGTVAFMDCGSGRMGLRGSQLLGVRCQSSASHQTGYRSGNATARREHLHQILSEREFDPDAYSLYGGHPSEKYVLVVVTA